METAKTWKSAVKRATVSGAVASVLSTAALAMCGRLERGDTSGPVNGPSQWIFGRRAAYERGPSVRHTIVGYAVHHVAATGWSLLYEMWRGRSRDSMNARLARAGATAALACFVDYELTPKRFRPGFEVQLSKPAMFTVYGAFALGLALAARRGR
jgi:hypothetical protein